MSGINMTKLLISSLKNININIEYYIALKQSDHSDNSECKQHSHLHNIPQVLPSKILGLLEVINSPEHHGKVELANLSLEVLRININDLFPIVEAAKLLELITLDSNFANAQITKEGKNFVEAENKDRKAIFAQQLKKCLPISKHIFDILQKSDDNEAPISVFIEELEQYFINDETQKNIMTFISWARFAGILSYDTHSKIVKLKNSTLTS